MKSNLYINEVRIDKEIPRDNYLRKLSVVRNLRRMGGLRFHKNVTFLVGENGVGKSTLIEGITVADASDVPDGVHAGIGKTGFKFIISTHSPILMTFPDAEVMEITEEGIRSVNYKDTEHFVVTKRFMDAPEKIVENLLGDN